jgi:Mrp family chromosome partitioning ATPase
LLEVRGIAGLSQVLQATGPVAELATKSVRPTQLVNLHVLPCGSRPSDPAELLTSTRFAELLAWSAGQYDQVLIDCPPVMAASDAVIVGRQADAVVLVLQPEKNHRRLVLRVVENLRAMQVSLIGIVANRVGRPSGSAFVTHEYAYESYDYRSDEEEPTSVPVRRRAA